MTWFIFIGDMLVMAFMIGLLVAVSLQSTIEVMNHASRIPLEDETDHG